MSDQPPVLGAEAIIAVLNARGVEYVVIDTFALQAFRALVPSTLDIDFTPASTGRMAGRARRPRAAIAVYTAARSVYVPGAGASRTAKPG